jgi:hypothetical protein
MTVPVTATEARVVLSRIDQRRSLGGPGEEALTALADLGLSNVCTELCRRYLSVFCSGGSWPLGAQASVVLSSAKFLL